jgi:hypothetical protein
MQISKRDKAIINDLFAEEKALDPVLKSVCPFWWHSVGQQVGNGYIDTFSCQEHHACDVIMIKPYTTDQLKAELQRVCKAANSEEWCGVYRGNGDGN